METKNKYVKIRVVPLKAAQRRKDIDPAEIWLDKDIESEALIELDPFEINDDVVELAEAPELADPVLSKLPKQEWENRPKHMWPWHEGQSRK